MSRVVSVYADLIAACVRFPGYVIERLFGFYLVGWGLVCAVEPTMFDTMPQAFNDLRGTTGAFHEWHYAILFAAVGGFQIMSARNRDQGRLGQRAVAALFAASALFGLAQAFVIDDTITSGSYNYAFLAVCEILVLARLLLIRWGKAKGLEVKSLYFARADRIQP